MTRYCTYIFKKGAKKGQNCKEECHLKTNFCKKHWNGSWFTFFTLYCISCCS